MLALRTAAKTILSGPSWRNAVAPALGHHLRVGAAARHDRINRSLSELPRIHERGVKTKKTCQVHKEHRPSITDPDGELTDTHHIHPQGEGGPDVPKNRIEVCPTGHRRIHRIMQVLHKHDGEMPTGWIRKFHPTEYRLAVRGYKETMAYRKEHGIAAHLPLASWHPAEPPKEAPMIQNATGSNATESHSNVALAGAQQVMVRAYHDALDEYDAKLEALKTLTKFAAALRYFWNAVVATILTDVILTVVPVINNALGNGDPIDWAKLRVAAVRVVLTGIVAYVVRLRKGNGSLENPPPPPPLPPVPVVPGPQPVPEPDDAGGDV